MIVGQTCMYPWCCSRTSQACSPHVLCNCLVVGIQAGFFFRLQWLKSPVTIFTASGALLYKWSAIMFAAPASLAVGCTYTLVTITWENSRCKYFGRVPTVNISTTGEQCIYFTIELFG